MAVVYSTNFKPGPQARLFYHAQQMDGSNYVQEMIWTQSNDSWAQGATIKNAYPNSRLSATVDDRIGVVRLFFSSGNHTLQESVMILQDPTGAYRDGESHTQLVSHSKIIDEELLRHPPPQLPLSQFCRPSIHLRQRHNLPLPLRLSQPNRQSRYPQTHHHRHPRLIPQPTILQPYGTLCHGPQFTHRQQLITVPSALGGEDGGAWIEGPIARLLGGESDWKGRHE